MKKAVKIIIVILVLLFVVAATAAFSVDSFVKAKAKERIITAEEATQISDADCIIVLGCRVWSDNTPSAMLSDRLKRGVELYKAGAAPKLLMSGDHGREDYDEVNVMRKYAEEAGVDSKDIFTDHAGFSTYDSLYRAKEIFGCKKLIVVTQRFHLARAVYIGRRLGMEVYGVECDNGYVYGTAKINALRESLARVKAVLDCELLKPQSKYLGEAIPISGKGSETDDKSFENKKGKT